MLFKNLNTKESVFAVEYSMEDELPVRAEPETMFHKKHMLLSLKKKTVH